MPAAIIPLVRKNALRVVPVSPIVGLPPLAVL
jgi:hypothetical protein